MAKSDLQGWCPAHFETGKGVQGLKSDGHSQAGWPDLAVWPAQEPSLESCGLIQVLVCGTS